MVSNRRSTYPDSLTFNVVVVGEEEVRLEPSVLVEAYGRVVGGEDVQVDGAHVVVVAGPQVRQEVPEHEGGDAVAAVFLQDAQRQNVRDLGAVTEIFSSSCWELCSVGNSSPVHQ